MWVHFCLTCLFYCGAVSKLFIFLLETLGEELVSLVLVQDLLKLNTLSKCLLSWTTGRLLFYRGSLTSWTFLGSTRDHIFLRSRKVVWPLPGCSLLGSLLLSLRSVSVHYCHAQTGLFCFRLFCYSMRAINSLFSLVFFLDLCNLYCFRTICLQYGAGWRCYCITIQRLLDWRALHSQDTSFKPVLILKR